jgi:hypothetical protein
MGWAGRPATPPEGMVAILSSCTQWLATSRPSSMPSALVLGGGLAPTEAQAFHQASFPSPDNAAEIAAFLTAPP